MFKRPSLKIVWPLAFILVVTMVAGTGCRSTPEPQPSPEPTFTVEPTAAPTLTPTATEPPPTAEPTPTVAAPQVVATVEPPAEAVIQYDFEDGAQGWGPRGEATVDVADDVAHSGAHSLLVTNRTAAWHGVALDVSKVLEPGNMYEIGGYVRLAEGAPPSRVIITMQRTPSGGDTVYEWIAPSAENGVTDGEWVHLQGQYLFSGEASELLLYVESPDAEFVGFYIDEMTIGGQTEVQIVPIQTDIPSVYETLAAYFPVGAAFGPSQLDSERHTALLARHFNSLTPENTMKPGPIQPSEGDFRWDNADRLVEFAQAHNMAVHGHTLVWHQQAAEWMFLDANGEKMTPTPENKELLLQRLETHIRAVVSRYKDTVNVWDVVNEVIDTAHSDCLRRSTWYKITGMDYIVTAFRVAREEAPDATLILNDYNTYQVRKRECIYTLVSDLQEMGVPVDGIGMQMHVNIQIPSIPAIEAAIERFAELGEVHVTELDMSMYTNNTTSYATISDELLLQQGYRYRDIFEVLKRHADAIGSVTFWGLADDTTWLKTFPTTRLNLPLLFDEQLRAKYAYWGVVDPAKLPGDSDASQGASPDDASLPPRSTSAKRGTPVIDAEEDAVWAGTEVITTGVWVVGESGSTAMVRTLWDDEYLYVFAVVTDSLLSNGAVDPWEQDSFEVFVDQNNAKTAFYEEDDGQYRVNYENVQSFGGAASADKITSATKLTPGGYIVELAIKLDAITPQEGMLIGADFQVNNDENGNGVRDSVVTWNDPTHQSYQDTSRLGVLQFVQ
ncbi:MAG: endo-1,4-beta-xylanase [Anaerolineae bacterium]|nr:endo-1,4-beta-xylanase [Anaerolineae bacterium]